MILQFKTKKKVIVHPVSLKEDYVRLIIERESERTALATGVQYRYQAEDGSMIKSGHWTITNDELNAIASMTQYPPNATEVERRNAQIVTGVFYTLSQFPDFGLTPNDWEIYTEPEEEIEEETINEEE